jgi:hypothetical protein
MASSATAADREAGAWPKALPLAAFALCVAHAVFLAAAFAFGYWLLDANGAPIATDFTGFWPAGKLVLEGHGAVYDWAQHKAAAVAAIGHDFAGGYPQFYPPPYFLLLALLPLLPYTASCIAWIVLTAVPYVYVMSRIIGERIGVLLALAFPAVLANAMIGQNGCITAALMGGALLALPRRPVLAGCLIGLLTYKPHFGVLIPLALVCDRQWRAFVSAAAVAAGLAALSWLVLGTAAWQGFFDALLTVNRSVFGMGSADYAKLQSVFGLVRAAGGNLSLAWALHGAAIAAMALWVVAAWSGRGPFAIKAAILSVGAVICAPYAYMYDLVLLAVPAAFLLRDGRDRGFLPGEMAGLGAACLLLLLFPLVKAPIGVGATFLLAALIARRWFRERSRFLVRDRRRAEGTGTA